MIHPRMSRWRGIPGLFIVAAVGIVAACSSDVPPPTVLQPLDLAPAEYEITPFDRNDILPTEYLRHVPPAIDAAAVQGFLARTPYSRASFLETYQSNGIRAADAIVAASRQYQINPIVLLVFTQVVQGLIGARTYRFPPERVEYIFGCGCYAPDQCLPELAGYDRQLACLGQALRKSLDDIQTNERTASGWGPEISSTTIDGAKVTPANAGTAAVYDRLPRVNEGTDSGAWAFWKVWQLYSIALGYSGPSETPNEGAWIGDACTSNATCSAFGDGVCANQFPGGLCTVKCSGACPSDVSRPEAFCASFPDGGYCLTVCNPEAPSCRDGYECVNAVGMVSGLSEHVCSPTNG